MSPQAMRDVLNLADAVLEYAEAELARFWFIMAVPRRFVSALRLGIRYAKKDLAFLLDASEGGAR